MNKWDDSATDRQNYYTAIAAELITRYSHIFFFLPFSISTCISELKITSGDCQGMGVVRTISLSSVFVLRGKRKATSNALASHSCSSDSCCIVQGGETAAAAPACQMGQGYSVMRGTL